MTNKRLQLLYLYMLPPPATRQERLTEEECCETGLLSSDLIRGCSKYCTSASSWNLHTLL